MIFGYHVSGQDAKEIDCYQIKYLDFFGLDKVEIIKWPESEVQNLTATDFSEGRTDTTIKTNFIIPMIVYQLKEYHPKCNPKPDINYFNQIISIYCRIREIKEESLVNKTVVEKIDFIRDDFYKQVEDDKNLPFMFFTLDSGPFFGLDYETPNAFEKIKTQKTDFGELAISKSDIKTVLTATDNENKIIWQKAITGLSDRYLSELNFGNNPVEITSVATIVHMVSEGEQLTLFLKNDGKFMFYYHSW